MALSIKDPEADRLARELATRTGETLTPAAIRHRCASLPVLDTRPAHEILGYDDHGLPACR